MPRKPLLRTQKFPYHVLARSNNKEWFAAGLGYMWNLFSFHLREIAKDYGVQVHAFVLMSNHFHMVLSTPQMNLDRAMQYLLRETTKAANRTSGRINHLFGGPYKWTVLYRPADFARTLKYVYRNPVKAGICPTVEQYLYSSIHAGFSGESYAGPDIVDCLFQQDPLLSRPRDEVLDWFNRPYTEAEEDCIRRALRRREFELTANRLTRKLPAAFTK